MTDARVELVETSEQTSSTLLVRVKARDQEAWRRFVHLYGPLLYGWCRRFGLQDADAADVSQDVFQAAYESIHGFRHDRKGDSLRGWLFTVTRNRVLDFVRHSNRAPEVIGGSGVQAILLQVPDRYADSGSMEEDENVLVRRVVDMVLDECKEETRQAFLRVVIAKQEPANVAEDLGMTRNAVYLAKCHILRRIREELAELVDI